MVLMRCRRASGADGENGLGVGESTANVDKRKRARLERDERDNEQKSNRRDSRGWRGRQVMGGLKGIDTCRQLTSISDLTPRPFGKTCSLADCLFASTV